MSLSSGISPAAPTQSNLRDSEFHENDHVGEAVPAGGSNYRECRGLDSPGYQ